MTGSRFGKLRGSRLSSFTSPQVRVISFDENQGVSFTITSTGVGCILLPMEPLGDFAKSLRHQARIHVKYAKKPRRYRQILHEIRERQPTTIIEVGVYEGARAVEMIEAASLGRSPEEIQYFGFDLFEMMTPETFDKELSKWPLTESKIRAKLQKTGAEINLFKGFTSDTLPKFAEERGGNTVDFAFIDGGHAIDTIQSDWDTIKEIISTGSSVLFDDYYVDCPQRIKEFGCNATLEGIDRQLFDWEVLPDVDRFSPDDGPLNVSIAKVRRRR